MITSGSRFWWATCALGVVGAFLYAGASGGEWFGSLVLLSVALAAAVPGVTVVALRDGDVPAPAAGAPAPVVSPRTALPAAWPALGALGAGVTVVGLAAGGALFYVGLAILAVTLAEWMVQSWAERATDDGEANRRRRNRIMYPVEIPALAVIGVGLVVVAFSRVLLALPKSGSTVIAMVVATAILVVAALLAARPRLGSSVLAAVAVVSAVALLAGGIIAAVAGEREFEEHEEQHEGMAPAQVMTAWGPVPTAEGG